MKNRVIMLALALGFTAQADLYVDPINGKNVNCYGVDDAVAAGVPGHGKVYRNIKPAASLPANMPWKLDELSKSPAFEWADGAAGEKNKKPRSLYYKGEIYKGNKTKVFAYYATPGILAGDPSKDKSLPALVLVHGGGGTAFDTWVKLWASRGYAAIAMDMKGGNPGVKTRRSDGGPEMGDDVKFGAIEEAITDQWQYHAVADVILAHSLILSFPEVNPDKTAITGISWGGYLTCIVAGLDDRFRAAMPVYGCGFLDKNSAWLDRFDKMSPQSRAKWVQLWDPSQYIGAATMPMFFVNGGTDHHFRPDSYAKTFELVKSPKNIYYVPSLKHGHIFDKPNETELFIGHHLMDGVSLPQVSTPVVNDKEVTAGVETKTKLIKAELHYTLDATSGENKGRKWISQAAKVEQTYIVAALPPKEATIWFLTVTDERDALVSSQLMFGYNK